MKALWNGLVALLSLVPLVSAQPVPASVRLHRDGHFPMFQGPPLPDNMIPGVVAVSVLRMEELPASECDTILVATIERQRTFVTPNQRGVYTEFDLAIEEVISEKSPAESSGVSRPLLYLGASATLANGKPFTPVIHGLGRTPEPGRRYPFFLRTRKAAQAYQLTKAWEIKDGLAQPMSPDDIHRSNSAYAGLPAARLLEDARRLPAQTNPLP